MVKHCCVPNATISWVMGDFQKKHVKAFMVIKEILMSYLTDPEFGYG